eukprot:UN16102
MYQSTFRLERFIIHPLGKDLKWGEICSYLAGQAGFNFFFNKVHFPS